jgi:hypothetical protein
VAGTGGPVRARRSCAAQHETNSGKRVDALMLGFMRPYLIFRQ